MTQGEPRALPKAAPIFRQAMQWRIQKLRVAFVGGGEGEAVGGEGVGEVGGVEVQAECVCWSLAQSSQREKCSGVSWSRSTFLPLPPPFRRRWRGG